MKEQDKIIATDQSNMDLNNIPIREFKVVAINILTGLEKRVEYINETLFIFKIYLCISLRERDRQTAHRQEGQREREKNFNQYPHECKAQCGLRHDHA